MSGLPVAIFLTINLPANDCSRNGYFAYVLIAYIPMAKASGFTRTLIKKPHPSGRGFGLG